MIKFTSEFNSLGYGRMEVECSCEEFNFLIDYIDLLNNAGFEDPNPTSDYSSRRSIKTWLHEKYGAKTYHIRNGEMKIIFSGPCTVLFVGGEKTVVRCEGEKFDHKKGAMMAFLKYALPKDQWNRLLRTYQARPKKEAEAAEALIRIQYGNKVYDRLIDALNEAIWRNNE